MRTKHLLFGGLAAALAAAPATLPAQLYLWGSGASFVSGCGGSPFIMCAEWRLAMTSATVARFEITNTSSHAASEFGRFEWGGLLMDVEPIGFSSSPGTSWEIANDGGGPGDGCTHVASFCVTTKEEAPDGLDAGESLWIELIFANAADAALFRPTELAIHDRHGPGPTRVCEGSGWATFNGATGANLTAGAPDPACVPSTVPEPATTALLATGLLGLIGAGRLIRRSR